MYPCIQFSPDVQLAVDVSATDVSQVEAGSDGGAGSLQPSPLLASVLTKTGSSGASAAAATAAVVETPSGGPSSLRTSSSLRLCSVGSGCACAVPYMVPSIGRHAQRHLGWRRRQVPIASHGVAAGLSTLLACPPRVPRAHRRVRVHNSGCDMHVPCSSRRPHAVRGVRIPSTPGALVCIGASVRNYHTQHMAGLLEGSVGLHSTGRFLGT